MNTVVEKLTMEEEIELLKSCADNFYDNGSSRATYDVIFKGKSAVVKVFLDFGGFYQSIKNELQFYSVNGGENVAQILAYGHNCLVCERVSPIDRDDIDCVLSLYDNGDLRGKALMDWCEYTGLSSEHAFDIVDVVSWLNDVCGRTSDNRQIGVTSDERIVAYDYGYDTSIKFDLQVGYMSEYLDTYSPNEILDLAIEMVRDNAEFEMSYNLMFVEEDESEDSFSTTEDDDDFSSSYDPRTSYDYGEDMLD